MEIVLYEDDIKKAIAKWIFGQTSIDIDEKDINLFIDFNQETIEATVKIGE